MSEHFRSLQTSAPPARVWQLWSDTSTWPAWNPDVSAMEPAGPLKLGAEMTMHTRAGRHHRMTVVDFQPGQQFSLATSPLPLSRFTFTCSVEPAAGGSAIRQSVAMSGILGRLMSAAGGDRAAKSFEPILAGLARAAEQMR